LIRSWRVERADDHSSPGARTFLSGSGAAA
jgi:hypothetical protein